MLMIFNEWEKISHEYIYGNVNVSNGLKFEKLRQSERCLLLFLCLFRPLSKALLKFSFTQPSHFCTQIEAATASSTPLFHHDLFSLASHDSAAQTLSICAVCIVSRLSVLSYSMNPNSLEATPLYVCVNACIQSTMHCCNARTVFPQHTEFQCVFAINS